MTLESAVLPGVATWVVDADHGSLPRHKEAFGGYRDLLRKRPDGSPLHADRRSDRAGTGGSNCQTCQAASAKPSVATVGR